MDLIAIKQYLKERGGIVPLKDVALHFRREADAASVVHGLDHIVYQLAHAVCHLRPLSASFRKYRIAFCNYLSECHGISFLFHRVWIYIHAH